MHVICCFWLMCTLQDCRTQTSCKKIKLVEVLFTPLAGDVLFPKIRDIVRVYLTGCVVPMER